MKQGSRYKTKAIPLKILKKGVGENDYPYLIRRLMPAAYQRIKVAFMVSNKEKPIPDCLTLVEPKPFTAKGRLTTECRKKLIKVLRHESKKTGLRMALVLGERNSIYVEPDGRVKKAPELPSGGVRLSRGPSL